jgi:hypothetical protein
LGYSEMAQGAREGEREERGSEGKKTESGREGERVRACG